MNKKNILLLADTIEDHAKRQEGLRGVGFNMDVYAAETALVAGGDHVDKCGTVACLAGWACLLAEPDLDDKELRTYEGSITSTARKFLGIGVIQSDVLFYPPGSRWGQIKPSQAVAVLRHLAETGEIDWSIADPANSD